MKNSPALAKYMSKNKIPKAPEWEAVDREGHGDISTNDFETEDTKNDPLEDHEGAESKAASSNLTKYQRLNKK